MIIELVSIDLEEPSKQVAIAHAVVDLDLVNKSTKKLDHKLKLVGGSPFSDESIDIITEDDLKP